MHAQVYLEIIEKNKHLPFKEIVAQVEKHYEGKAKGRGSGYKQFKRWEFFNADRLSTDGYLQNVSKRELDEFINYRNYKALSPNLNFDCAWEEIGGNAYERISSGHNGGLGRVNTIAQDPDDPDILYVGTPAGGLWRSTSGGGWDPASPSVSYWEPLTDGLPVLGVSGIAIDPTSPIGNRTIYILSGDGDGAHTRSIGVLKSFDNGATWFETGLSVPISQGMRGYKLTMHPTDPNTLFVASSQGIFRTTDGGINWALEQFGWFFDIEFRPNTPDTMYAGRWGAVFRSLDGGDTWQAISLPNCDISPAARIELAVTPANPDYVYGISGGIPQDMNGDPIAGQFNGVFLSTDSGECFSQQANQPNILGYPDDGSDDRSQGTYDLAIAVSPTDADEVHTGGINCWKSTDGGLTWNNTTSWYEDGAPAGDYTHADIHFLGFLGNNLYCGSDGGIALSTNNADDWSFISQGLRTTQFYRISAFSDDGDDYVMGGTQDNGLNQFIDTGSDFGNLQHWEGGDGFEISPDIANDNAFGATQNGCMDRFSYPNGGLTSLTVFPGQTNDSCGGRWLTPHLFDANSSALLVGYQDVWRSTDAGNNFTNITNGNTGPELADHLAVAPSNSNVIYVSKDTFIYRTMDNGASWQNITSNLPLTENVGISYFTIDPSDENRIWLTISGFANGEKVYSRDINASPTWTNISGSLPNLPANCIVYEQGSADGIYVGTDVGVYYRDNNLGDWLLFSNALPNAIITELEINYTTNKLYAGTFARGIWCTELISNCSDICLNCPVFDNFHSQDNVYSSEDCIQSTAVVYDNTDVTYEAENYIHLQEYFHVKSNQGAVFYATIDDCTPAALANYSYANLRDLSGFYLGKLPAHTAMTITADNDKASTQNKGIKLYPNPVNEQLTIELTLAEDTPLVMNLYNMKGQLVQQLERGDMTSKGIFNRQYNLSELKDASYLLEVRINAEQHHLPIIKLSHR